MHKKVNRIQPKSEKRSQKKHKPWIVHVFNHQCCVAYITGLYSCQWKIEQEGKSRRELCCCSSVQRDGKELDHTFWDMGNVGWSLPPWGLIRISRTGHARTLVLSWKGTTILEPELTLPKLVLVFFIFFHFYSSFLHFLTTSLISFTYLFTHFCFYSFSEPWKSEVQVQLDVFS